MAVISTKEYIGVPRDVVENFNGRQLVYVSWDHHLLFAAPFLICVPPETTFGDMVEQSLMPLLGPDIDSEKIDWSSATWLMSNETFSPDFNASLADNGVVHKANLRFRTRGLNTVCATDRS